MENKNFVIRSVFLLVTVLLCGCKPLFGSHSNSNSDSSSPILSALTSGNVVAKVGAYEITKQDVEYRNKVLKFYYPEETRNLGQELLTKSFVMAEILNRHGRPTDKAVLEKESERIDKATMMPEGLAQIKAIFGEDREGYLKVFVLPVYAERIIYFDFFLHDPEIQKETLAKAEAFRAKAAQDPKQFESLAKAAGLKVATFTVSKMGGLQWIDDEKRKDEEGPTPPAASVPPDLQKKMAQSQEQAANEEGTRFVEELIQPIKPKQMISKVIDRHETWMVFFYEGPDKKKPQWHILKGVGFPKANYSKWLEEEKAKIPVQVF